MRPPALVPRVPAKFQKILNVVVPGFEVCAPRPTALAALVHRHELIVVKFQERNDSLAFTVRAADVAPGSAHRSPRPPQAAGPFAEKRILRYAANHDALDAVIDLVQVARGQLTMQCAAIKERWCGGAVAPAFVESVQAANPPFPLLLFI